MDNTRDYAAVPHEYLEEMAALNDGEFGRLVRALLEYSKAGTPIALSGNERFYAVRVMNREDRYQKSYVDANEKRSAAGKAGADARWNSQNATGCDRIRSDAKACDAMRSDGKNGNTKTKTETKTETKAPTGENAPPRAKPFTQERREEMILEALGQHGEQLLQAVRAWTTYKIEKRDGYQETGYRNLLSQIRKHAEQYGDDAVADIISVSMSSNYAGIVFDRLKSRQKVQNNGVDLDASYRMMREWANG